MLLNQTNHTLNLMIKTFNALPSSANTLLPIVLGECSLQTWVASIDHFNGDAILFTEFRKWQNIGLLFGASSDHSQVGGREIPVAMPTSQGQSSPRARKYLAFLDFLHVRSC
jgi:hypothetical protein